MSKKKHIYDVSITTIESDLGCLDLVDEQVGIVIGSLKKVREVIANVYLANLHRVDRKMLQDASQVVGMSPQQYLISGMKRDPKGGLELKSPSHTIRSVHVHCFDVTLLTRKRSEKAYVAPTTIKPATTTKPVKLPKGLKGRTKHQATMDIIKEHDKKKNTKELVAMVMETAGMSDIAARTYVYNARNTIAVAAKKKKEKSIN